MKSNCHTGFFTLSGSTMITDSKPACFSMGSSIKILCTDTLGKSIEETSVIATDNGNSFEFEVDPTIDWDLSQTVMICLDRDPE